MGNQGNEFFEWYKEIGAAVAAFQERVEEVAGPIVEWLRVNLPALQEGAARLARLPTAVQQSFRAAGFPPFRARALGDLAPLEAEFTANGVGAAALLVERMCREAVSSSEFCADMVADWKANPITATRVPILEEALWAHAEGRFALSIPPFLAQLEGIVLDCVTPPPTASGERPRQRHTLMKQELERLSANDPLMGSVTSDFVAKIVLAKFDQEHPEPDFSRHAILHGADLKYGTELNSVKAILIFDYVQDLLRERAKEAALVDSDPER